MASIWVIMLTGPFKALCQSISSLGSHWRPLKSFDLKERKPSEPQKAWWICYFSPSFSPSPFLIHSGGSSRLRSGQNWIYLDTPLQRELCVRETKRHKRSVTVHRPSLTTTNRPAVTLNTYSSVIIQHGALFLITFKYLPILLHILVYPVSLEWPGAMQHYTLDTTLQGFGHPFLTVGDDFT